MKRKNRSHSTAYKLQVVQAYLEGDGGMDAIARKHGLSPYSVKEWVAKYRRGELTLEMAHQETLEEYEIKIAALERKVGQLSMEVDFLKKYQRDLQKKGVMPSMVSGPVVEASRKGAAS